MSAWHVHKYYFLFCFYAFPMSVDGVLENGSAICAVYVFVWKASYLQILTKPQKIISRYTKLYKTVSDFMKISHLLWNFTKKSFLKSFACNMFILQVSEVRNFAYLYKILFKRNFICFIWNIVFLMAWNC